MPQTLPAPDEIRPDAHVAEVEAVAPVPVRRFYLRVRTRFLISVAVALAWAGFSLWLSLPWIGDLASYVTLPVAILIVAGIAIIPGYLNMQLIASIALDRPPPLDLERSCPPITLMIAAYNEASSIEETVGYALGSEYPGELEVVVADDGSTDETPDIVRRLAATEPRLRLIEAAHGGKAGALNTGLRTVKTPLVATIDADTLLLKASLHRAVSRLLQAPADTVAVAGSVLVRNSRANALARMQEWDYFLAIASVKRQQALLQGTLVAQGAFSLYRVPALREAGGWPDRIGEDIVLTWAMIQNGGRTTFEPTAVAFTEVPTEFKHFIRQRQRWARGMIEGLKDYGPKLVGKRKMLSHSILVNYLFPFLDGMYSLVFLPGVILALTGNFIIVGPWTIAVLPINILIASVMLWRQHRVFREMNLKIRRNYAGFLCYLLLYAPIMSPVSFVGYLKELAGAKRRWK